MVLFHQPFPEHKRVVGFQKAKDWRDFLTIGVFWEHRAQVKSNIVNTWTLPCPMEFQWTSLLLLCKNNLYLQFSIFTPYKCVLLDFSFESVITYVWFSHNIWVQSILQCVFLFIFVWESWFCLFLKIVFKQYDPYHLFRFQQLNMHSFVCVCVNKLVSKGPDESPGDHESCGKSKAWWWLQWRLTPRG